MGDPEAESMQSQFGGGRTVRDGSVGLPEEEGQAVSGGNRGLSRPLRRVGAEGRGPVGQEIDRGSNEIEKVGSLVGLGFVVEGPGGMDGKSGSIGEGSLANLADMILEESSGLGGREHEGGRRGRI